MTTTDWYFTNNDAISTALTATRNANTRRKATIRIPATKMTACIVQISAEEGFIKNPVKHRDNGKEFLDVSLKYLGKKKDPYITVVRRVSKPGLRVYSDHREQNIGRYGNCNFTYISRTYYRSGSSTQKNWGGNFASYLV
uniref:Ribosomal protein S8 n=1 Tax=Diplazium wichurae TaxID=65712 RepID=A0A6B9MCM6_9MONI|nr:ribosomal protein S8 [Diplazium wichurae]